MIRVRRWEPGDADQLWAILEPIIRAGETYTLERDMSREAALDYWTARTAATFVAVDGAAGRVVGTYYIRTNQQGGGAHVCNAGFMVAADAGGRGIGRRMGEHALAEAAAMGYRAMQFNFVVETNAPAVQLWRDLGFSVVGCLPGAFAHPRLGDVDALVMYRRLDQP